MSYLGLNRLLHIIVGILLLREIHLVRVHIQQYRWTHLDIGSECVLADMVMYIHILEIYI